MITRSLGCTLPFNVPFDWHACTLRNGVLDLHYRLRSLHTSKPSGWDWTHTYTHWVVLPQIGAIGWRGSTYVCQPLGQTYNQLTGENSRLKTHLVNKDIFLPAACRPGFVSFLYLITHSFTHGSHTSPFITLRPLNCKSTSKMRLFTNKLLFCSSAIK